MQLGEFAKSMVVNLIGALIVTVMIWFFIATLHNEYLPFIAALCGMYVFAGFGVNNIIEGKIIPDNYSRFVLAIACIIIYVIAFLYVMPMIFGSGVFPAPLVLTSNIVLDTPIILAIFAVIVLVINYLDYR